MSCLSLNVEKWVQEFSMNIVNKDVNALVNRVNYKANSCVPSSM